MKTNSTQKTGQLSIYEWEQLKREQRNKNRRKLDEFEKETREEVWNYLLGNRYPEKYNAYQAYAMHAYHIKPNPRDGEHNAGAIAVREAQGKFIQLKDIAVNPSEDLYHLDLNSAYITALANIKHTLKYVASYELDEVTRLSRDDYFKWVHEYVLPEKFNIIKVNCTMPYNKYLNMFTPNTKIRYKNKPVHDANIPPYGAIVNVRVELFVNRKYSIDSWKHWTEWFKDYDINYSSVRVFVYDMIPRKRLFTLSKITALQDSMKQMDQAKKKYTKAAMVSLTGMLANVDPGRRLIMIATSEEVIRRLYERLTKETHVVGVQVDGLFFHPYEWRVNPTQLAYEIGSQVFRWRRYSPKAFSKLELYTKKDYKETAFRLQEV